MALAASRRVRPAAGLAPRGASSALVVALLLFGRLGGGGGDASRARNTWFGADKVKHFVTSFFVQSVSYSVLRLAGARPHASLAGATAMTAAVGIGKEVRDRRSYGLFSAGDLLWDAAGIGTASAMLSRAK